MCQWIQLQASDFQVCFACKRFTSLEALHKGLPHVNIEWNGHRWWVANHTRRMHQNTSDPRVSYVFDYGLTELVYRYKVWLGSLILGDDDGVQELRRGPEGS